MMNLKEKFRQAKENGTYLVERSYFPNSISWQEVLDFIYKESTVEDMGDNNKNTFQQAYPERNLFITIKGNVSIHHPLWIKGLSGQVWKDMPELKDFLIKLNKDFDRSTNFDDCVFYKGTNQRVCTCDSLWHVDGMVVSLASRLIGEHQDVFDAGYIQLVGKSYWKISGHEEICVLNPADILLLPHELTHEVWGDGPRAGLLLTVEEENKGTKS